ncbi:hypothetical protein AB0J67_19370, partial [Catellatospora sp. NPDC049609]
RPPAAPAARPGGPDRRRGVGQRRRAGRDRRRAADAYAAIAATGSATAVDRMAWPDFTSLVGQDDALALDARYAA